MSYGRAKTIKRRSLEWAQSVLGRTAMPQAYVRAERLRGAIILMYHSVADQPRARWIDPDNWLSPKVFKLHAQFLARHRKVIALSDLVERIKAGAPIDAGTVVVTFDDGYLDNAEIAFPILASYQLPATLFLPTKYIDSGEDQWIDRLYSLFVRRTVHQFSVSVNGTEDLASSWTLNHRSSRRRAYAQLSEYLLGSTHRGREKLLTSLARQLRPLNGGPRLTMNWEDVKQALDRYRFVDLGSHGDAHLDLTIYDRNVVQHELQRSKCRIQEVTGRRSRYFSFPYNRVSTAALQMLEPLGYEAAVASANSVVRVENDSHIYCLPRLEAPQSLGRLAFLTSGAYPELSTKLLRRR